ncbi:MAG: hypothetical protein R3E10_00665 [Gemmatimonadota bacterium]
MSDAGMGRDSLGGTRRDMRRAIRRIGLLEMVMLGMAMVLSMVAGALIAFLLERTAGLSFRVSWIVCSVVLFAVPAFLQLRETSAPAGRARAGNDHVSDENDGG